jgi:hypothetical protein
MQNGGSGASITKHSSRRVMPQGAAEQPASVAVAAAHRPARAPVVRAPGRRPGRRPAAAHGPPSAPALRCPPGGRPPWPSRPAPYPVWIRHRPLVTAPRLRLRNAEFIAQGRELHLARNPVKRLHLGDGEWLTGAQVQFAAILDPCPPAVRACQRSHRQVSSSSFTNSLAAGL